jgi:hypothetical protein
MKIDAKKLSISLCLFGSSIALFLHGYLGHFSRYIADDFCSASQANRIGVLRAAWFWYLTWSGRFSASILDGVVGRLGPGAVPFLVPFTITIWLIALTVLFTFLLYQLKSRFLISFTLATTMLFALFLLTPEVRGSLYWGQGMRSVVPPLIMGTVQIIFLTYIQVREWTNPQLVFWGILSFSWALIAGGFSETYAAFQVAALLFSLLVVLIRGKFKFSKTTLFLASSLLGAIGAMLIIIWAPGNLERQAFYPSPPGIVGLLTISLKGFLGYIANLVSAPEKVLSIFGIFSLAVVVGTQFPQETDSRLLVAIPILTIGFLCICFLPAAYGLSDAPPNRTLILPTYFFLGGLLALGIVCGTLLGKKQNVAVSDLLPALAMTTILLSASINSLHLYQSRSEFIEYAILWDKMNIQVLQAKQDGITPVIIPVIPNWASLNTPNDNPKYWVNICMSSYYNVQILADPRRSTP